MGNIERKLQKFYSCIKTQTSGHESVSDVYRQEWAIQNGEQQVTENDKTDGRHKVDRISHCGGGGGGGGVFL
jgi:hypothetical protein